MSPFSPFKILLFPFGRVPRGARWLGALMAALALGAAGSRADETPKPVSFEVTGAVNSPGVQTFAENQVVSLGFLIGACGGLGARADGHAVSVMHRSRDGKEVVLIVDARAEIEGRSREVVILKSGDLVHVPAKGEARSGQGS